MVMLQILEKQAFEGFGRKTWTAGLEDSAFSVSFGSMPGRRAISS